MYRSLVRFKKAVDLQPAVNLHLDDVQQENPPYMKHRMVIKQDASYSTKRGGEYMTKVLLKVEDLKKYFPIRSGMLAETIGLCKSGR